jgi:hypothetical protein
VRWRSTRTAASGPARARRTPGGGSITFGGTGVYTSDDGGATWKKRGLDDSGNTGRIAVDPSNPDRIFVAAAGSLFNPGGERGIYRSENGGASWKRVLAPETPFAGGADLAIDPTNPNRIFAAMWDHRREPDLRTYGGLGSGLFRSDDGGDTWTRLENTVTNSPRDVSGLKQDASLGRIGVALAPSNPNRVYVISTATFGQDKGFYVSDDGGDSFRAQPRPGSQGGFGWWFGPALGRSRQPGPRLRGGRQHAPLLERRRDLEQRSGPPRRPACDGLGPGGPQPGVRGQ